MLHVPYGRRRAKLQRPERAADARRARAQDDGPVAARPLDRPAKGNGGKKQCGNAGVAKKTVAMECNTRTSQEVTHPSTTLAQARLTAEF